MTEPARVELTVLGERLSVRTSASPEYLRGLGVLIEERARARGQERDRSPACSC